MKECKTFTGEGTKTSSGTTRDRDRGVGRRYSGSVETCLASSQVKCDLDEEITLINTDYF